MNLTLFFRLILTSIFQRQVCHDKIGNYNSHPMAYNNQLFFCPRITCVDDWNISLQIHNGNYCESENGYREFGHTIQRVEFGFPTEDDKDLHPFCECYGSDIYDSDTNEYKPFTPDGFTAMGTVGSIPIEDIEKIITKHGGIDWDKTISIHEFEKLTRKE